MNRIGLAFVEGVTLGPVLAYTAVFIGSLALEMMLLQYSRWLTLGVVVAVAVLAWGVPDAGAKPPPNVSARSQPLKPSVTLSPKVVRTPVAPRIFSLGPCGVGQTQCYLAGGKVTALAADAPENMRSKVCAFSHDAHYGCGTCERCPLNHTVGAFCSARGCDYKECEKDFVDLDKNRKNGCEQYRPTQPATPPGPKCKTDADCSYLGENDGLFAHAHGECKAGAGADARGCSFVFARCSAFQVPSEDQRRCVFDEYGVQADLDRDGFHAREWGGDDCDDGDSTRFPGNREVCDRYNHDEDCDSSTHGGADADGDSLADGACCNVLASGAKFCGTDCDDQSSALALSGQRCAPDGSGKAQVCAVSRASGAQVASWSTRACATGATCRPQPNGTGICQ